MMTVSTGQPPAEGDSQAGRRRFDSGRLLQSDGVYRTARSPLCPSSNQIVTAASRQTRAPQEDGGHPEARPWQDGQVGGRKGPTLCH